MPINVSLDELLASKAPIFDVRSPGEFQHGHIPGTLNLPLMSDADRVLIGTAYKERGQDFAIELGFELLGPKLLSFFKNAKEHIKNREELILVLCWRGGMRSGFVARLLESFGYKTATLKGGYKTFRRWVLKKFESFDTVASPRFNVLGGLTGSGKTAILKSLRERGEQVIDLEDLACHRGSVFGMLGMPAQPATEFFHNQIALQCHAFDLSRPIWIEDESRLIGRCHLPDALYRKMISSSLIIIQRPIEERIENLLIDYGQFSKEALIESTLKISNRFGGQRANQIIDLLSQGNMKESSRLMLDYYDKAYEHSLLNRVQAKTILDGVGLTTEEWASLLLNRPLA